MKPTSPWRHWRLLLLGTLTWSLAMASPGIGAEAPAPAQAPAPASLDLKAALARRQLTGAPGTREVRKQLARWKKLSG